MGTDFTLIARRSRSLLPSNLFFGPASASWEGRREKKEKGGEAEFLSPRKPQKKKKRRVGT